MANALRRLALLQAQLAPGEAGPSEMAVPQQQQQLVRSATSAAVKGLPRFDPYVMETYLDDLRDLKRQVYDLFKFKPELLPAVEEGMSKGARACVVGAAVVQRPGGLPCRRLALA